LSTGEKIENPRYQKETKEAPKEVVKEGKKAAISTSNFKEK